MAKFIQSGKVGWKFPRGNTFSFLPGTARWQRGALTGGGAFLIGHPVRSAPSTMLTHGPPPRAGEDQDTTIHTAIPIIITFSVSDRKPSGTLLDPPTQAHFSSRRSI